MSPLPEIIHLEAEDEAQRLWAGAEAAFAASEEELLPLLEAVDLGVRAAEVLAVDRLQAARARFPATIQLQLDLPEPPVVPRLHAIAAPQAMDFVGVLDLLSEEGLECVNPGMHRGWEDRRFACARSRTAARDALGISLDQATRDQLMVLAAYRNRVFRYPPPIEVRPAQIREAYPALRALVASLF
jgi:hypothetical protein